MAYNNFPIGYQPQYYPQMQSQQAQSSNGIIWVQGESAAKSYPVAPNSSVPLWDSEANVIYIKSADMSGMPSIKILDYTMRDNTPKSAEISPQSDFATKAEVDSIKQEISSLKAKFERMGNSDNKRKEKGDGK